MSVLNIEAIEVGDYVLKEGITTLLRVSYPLKVLKINKEMLTVVCVTWGSEVRLSKKKVMGIFKDFETAQQASDAVTDVWENAYKVIEVANKLHTSNVYGTLEKFMLKDSKWEK